MRDVKGARRGSRREKVYRKLSYLIVTRVRQARRSESALKSEKK
jgi:hypothetical protein